VAFDGSAYSSTVTPGIAVPAALTTLPAATLALDATGLA
jgi:hypothetical protein